MDTMLKDASYSAELEELRRSGHDALPAEGGGGAGGGPGGGGEGGGGGDASEEDSQVSTSEALDMLRQARAPPSHAFSHTLIDVPVTLSGALNAALPPVLAFACCMYMKGPNPFRSKGQLCCVCSLVCLCL